MAALPVALQLLNIPPRLRAVGCTMSLIEAGTFALGSRPFAATSPHLLPVECNQAGKRRRRSLCTPFKDMPAMLH